MVEFSGHGAAKHAATITTAAQAVGFAAALLLGGALIQYLRCHAAQFWVLSAVLAALLPRHGSCRAIPAARPTAAGVPKPPSYRTICAMFRGRGGGGNFRHTHGVLVLSLGSQVAAILLDRPTRS